jgi:hypothetical protein
VFADLDSTIRELLIKHVPLSTSEIDVSFDAPDREWSGRLSRPAVNVFLYDIRENLHLRETAWDVERSNGAITKRKAPMRFDVRYQVTVWARAAEDEHRLLWRVLGALARNSLIPDDVLQGGLKNQPFPISAMTAQPEQVPPNLSEVWQSIDNRIRPSLTYVVTLALDPNVVETIPPVLSRTTTLERLDDAPEGTRVPAAQRRGATAAASSNGHASSGSASASGN